MKILKDISRKLSIIFSPKKRGESIIEILIAFAIFSVIAVSSLGIMNRGLQSAQTSLETTIARANIDAQAERIRFIADSAESGGDYTSLWENIAGEALSATDPDGGYNKFMNDFKQNDGTIVCSNLALDAYRAFVIKTDNDSSTGFGIEENVSAETDAIPSADVIYTGETDDEGNPISTTKGGLFVVAVEDPNGDYYDFYINTCWDTPGQSTASKLSTTIRIQTPGKKQESPIESQITDGEKMQIVYHWNGDVSSTQRPNPPSGNTEWLSGNTNYESLEYRSNAGTPSYTEVQITSYPRMDDNKDGQLSSINVLDANKRYNGYEFIGWYLDDNFSTKAPDDLYYICDIKSVPGEANLKADCKWIDESGVEIGRDDTAIITNSNAMPNHMNVINLYAKWDVVPADAKPNLYCVIYDGEGTISGTTVSGTVDPTCVDPNDGVTDLNNVAVSNNTFTAGDNFEQFSWRTNKKIWNGSITSGTSDIVKFDGTVNLNGVSTECNAGLDATERANYNRVYCKTLYPQWRAKIYRGTDKEALNIRLSYNCPKADHASDCARKEARRKFLNAYVASSSSSSALASYNSNKTFSDGSYASFGDINRLYYFERFEWIEMSWSKPYSNRKIQTTNNSTAVYSTVNFKNNGNNGILYYSIYAETQNSDENKLKTADTVKVNYNLKGGKTGAISLTPSGTGKICWNVFAFDTDNNALYIINSTNDTTARDMCVIGNKFPSLDNYVPF